VQEWTVEEARRALEWVAPLAIRAQELARRAAERAGERRRRVRGNGHRATGDGAELPGTGDLAEVLRKLGDQGVVVRDPVKGLLDFPARSQSGRPYWLCWVVGEDDVAWWHWPEDGFAGRTPLTDPPP
jgi:hypothetical protein